jgi:TolB-like protein
MADRSTQNNRLSVGIAMLVLALPATVKAQASVCDELNPAVHEGVWAVAPFDCREELQSACGELVHQLLSCLKEKNVTTITPGNLTAMVDEEAIRMVLGAEDMGQLRQVGKIVPAQFLLTGEVVQSTNGARAVLRLVRLEDGRIVSGSRLNLTDTGKIEIKAAEARHKIASGAERVEAVEPGLRILSDRLAEGFKALDQKARYKRIAVVDLDENSPLAKEQRLGVLVSSELVVRFTKDRNLIVIERSQLGKVVNEYVMAQQGVIDESTVPEFGKIAGADAVALGTVSQAGDAFVVHVRIVDVETGLTVVAESISFKAEGLITLASEALVLRSRGGAVYRSLLLPGWGQLYNKEKNKAVAFGIGVGTFAVGTITTQVLASIAQRDYRNAGTGANFDGLATRVENLQLTRNLLLALLAVSWGYNVFDAYLNGVTFDSAVTAGGTTAGPAAFTW